MTLKSRLSRLQKQAGIESSTAPPSPATLRERIRRLERRPHDDSAGATLLPAPARALPVAALARRLEGELLGDGVIHIHRRLPLTGRLGSFELASLRARPCLPGEVVAGQQRQVYIDTETTGLSGGSGTLAFLVGMAVVGDGAIILDQFLLTRFAAEATLLSVFAGQLSAADRLVSYNGKSYDLPLLLTRFRLQGLAAPFAELAHLDLLHPVRRLFGARWNDCRLLSVERNLIGLQRIDDLPGSEAPAAWFGYVRGREAGPLLKVVDHNRQDIVSLAVAHTALAQAIAQPLDAGLDLHALARWLSDSDEDAARRLLLSHAGHLCDDGKRLLGRLLRRAGDWRRAVALWEDLAARGCTDSMERLAKYHEHVSKDLAAARRCCDMLPGDSTRQQHRRQRINHKLKAAAGRREPAQSTLLPAEN